MVLMIHVVPFMVDAAPVIARLADLAPGARLPLMHSMMGTLPGKAEWFATMERAGVPMFNDVEEMAEAAGLLARYPALRDVCPSRHSAHRSFPRPEAAISLERLDSQAFSGICTTVAFLPLFVGLEENAWPLSGAKGGYCGRTRQEAGQLRRQASECWAKKAGEADGVHDDARRARRPVAG